MKKLGLLFLTCLASSVASADYIGGTAFHFAPPPPSVLPGNTQTLNISNFDGQQNVTLTSSLNVDYLVTGLSNDGGAVGPANGTDMSGSGSINSGTVISSYYMFWDSSTSSSFDNRTAIFDRIILGVNFTDASLDNSDFLGSLSTTYPDSLAGRGLESNDGFSIVEFSYLENSIFTLTMLSNSDIPGDWIRIITAGTPTAVPLPPSVLLLISSLVFIGLRISSNKEQ